MESTQNSQTSATEEITHYNLIYYQKEKYIVMLLPKRRDLASRLAVWEVAVAKLAT
jgi:hypothetical protein